VIRLRLFVNPRAALPIYQQLVDQIKSAVASGMFPPSKQLPSVRELAGELAINPNTVARAYSILENEGIILRRQGSGTFVADKPAEVRDLTALERKLEGLLVEAYHLQVKPEKLRAMFEDALNKWELREGK
jgi:GntR family transcriptional regulator